EAQAGYDRAVANEISAENLLDNTREALREITGEYIDMLSPLSDAMTLVEPNPNEIETWTKISSEQNLKIIAAKHALESARQEIKIQRAGHFPTLDLVANHGFNSTGGRFGGTTIQSDAIGLELNVPIYQGGLINSQTREAQQQYNAAREQLERQYRAAQRQTREAYRGVISGISQVHALKQALISTETALQATQAGFEVGTRTAVDVVASERATLEAKRDYARARYNYIGDSLELKRAAGTLSPEDLQQLNNWLE
ncbi:MAG: TolC family protein, partial [Gammaproteobacteria bacterium]